MTISKLAIGLLLLCAETAALAQGRHHVFLMSFDALGYQRLTEDPAAAELTALQKMLKTGAHAEGLMPAYPSTTANGHAALWTGTYAGGNGILYNSTPVLPRAEHTFAEHVVGFRSDALTAEPIWLAAARQHRSVVAHQVTQAYPFSPNTAGSAALRGLTIVNGFQSQSFSPWRILRANSEGVRKADCNAWKELSARKAVACFEWTIGESAGKAAFFAVLLRDRMLIANSVNGPFANVRLHSAESEPPRGRELARYWSSAIEVKDLPGQVPAAATFRLFALSPDTADFELLQSPVQETAIRADDSGGLAMARDLIHATGPMVGNGAVQAWTSGQLGEPAYRGGSGIAEQRFLETIELVVRQQIAESAWLFRRQSPDLHITYLSSADDIDHLWYAFDRAGDERYKQFRRWGYAVINRSAEALLKLASPGDSVVVTSDHGMAPVRFLFGVNLALQAAGLQALNHEGAVDAARSRAVAYNTCIMLNTTDWKSGIVKPGEREQVLQQVKAALLRTKTDDGQSIVTKVHLSKEDMAFFGHRGPAGADLCFDLLPNYGPSDVLTGEMLTRAEPTRGMHGFDPQRADMKATLLIKGPRVPAGANLGPQRSASVAALIAQLLAIQPPGGSNFPPPLQLK